MDAVVCELHRLCCVVLILERGDDCKSFGITAMLSKPARGLGQLGVWISSGLAGHNGMTHKENADDHNEC